MSKSWKQSGKGVWSKGEGYNRKKEQTRREEEQARKDIQRIVRRTGEKVELYFQ